MHFQTLIKNILTLFKLYYALLLVKIGFHPPVFTMAEVEEQKNHRWIIVDNDVYCLASMSSHSGGLAIIVELAGRDVTRIFHEVHLASAVTKRLINRKYWIGKVHRSTEPENLGYFLKENLIDHKIVAECKIPRVITADEESAMEEQFKQHVAKSNFPCLNAKIALKRNAFSFNLYDILATEETTKLLYHNLLKFINHQSMLWEKNHMLTTYVACFRMSKTMSEELFEILLWKQLRLLHVEDVRNGMKWSKNYSDDPIDSQFGFSIGERAFFIVGLHPNSSRKARQFIMPAIAFNSHDQFMNLRRLKMLTEVRQVIRNTDQHHNGSMNPNLIPNEENSSIFEYSGKPIQSGWTPEFKSLHPKSV